MGSGTAESQIPLESTTAESPSALLLSLQQRAETLVCELQTYQAYLKKQNKSHEVELRILRRGSDSEAKSLRSYAIEQSAIGQQHPESDRDTHESRRLHVLRSSNLPFYEAIWQTAKTCSAVTALGKRTYWQPPQHKRHAAAIAENGSDEKPRRENALVDIISDGGLLWTKVSIVTQKRLLFDIAKEGWGAYNYDTSSDDGSHEDGHTSSDSGQTAMLELVKVARQLSEAAQSVRVSYRHPLVRFVFPKLAEGMQEDVDNVIADIRATGAMVECGASPSTYRTESLEQSFESMLPSSGLPDLTQTLNIDCTILLALISDISHFYRAELPPCPTSQSGHYQKAILQQVEAEERSPLLPIELYPALGGHDLICTNQAAQRMREIVHTMGTEDELARAQILLGEEEFAGKAPEALREVLRARSSHPLPESLLLPIQVVVYEPDATSTALAKSIIPDQTATPATSPAKGRSPSTIADQLVQSMHLSTINKSVFLYGWRQSLTTITSNRVVAVGIEKHIEQILDEIDLADAIHEEDFEAPKIWVCETARSLVGKEKQGNGQVRRPKR